MSTEFNDKEYSSKMQKTITSLKKDLSSLLQYKYGIKQM